MPRRRRRQQGLERVLGTPALFATAYGNVGSSIYYALGVTAVFALGLTPVVFIVAGLIFACTAATYAEGTVRYPEAGGSSSFARHAFDETVSFGAAWAQMLVYVATVTTSAFFVPHYLSIFWDPLRENPWDVVVGIVVVIVLVVLNIVGVQEAAKLNVFLAVVDFATQLLLVAVGIVLVLDPQILVDNVHWGVAPTWSNLALAVPVAMLAYTGVETVSNLAEEVRDPVRSVPNAYKLVAGAVFAIYFTLPWVALSAMPVELVNGEYQTTLGLPPEEGGYANDPVLGLVQNLGIANEQLLHAMEIYVGVLAATILFIATNAGVIGASRITYSMATYRQIPEVFRRLHPKFKTPWLSIVLFGGIAPAIVMLPGDTTFIGTLYAFGATLSFTVAHAALVRIRMRPPPEAEEVAFRARPNLRARGIDWPVFALVGGAATGVSWLVIVVQNPSIRWAGLGWLAAGFVFYVVYRRRVVRRPLGETVRAPVILSAGRGRRVHAAARPGRGGPAVRGDGGRGTAGLGAARADRGHHRARGAAPPAPRRRAAGGGGPRRRRARRGACDRRLVRRGRDHANRPRAAGRPRDRGRGDAPQRRDRGHGRAPARAAREGDLRRDRRLRPEARAVPGHGRRSAGGRMMQAYALGTLVLSSALVVLGIVMTVLTAARGGGVGLLLGPLFALAGAGRLYLQLRR